MNTYKLNNIIKKDLLKTFKNEQISKKHFSFKLLRQLCETYPVIEFTEHDYCCYGEDKCCWIDENTCWYRRTTIKNRNKLIYQGLKRGLKRKTNKFNIYNRNVFIGENDKYITYCIPLRDVDKTDYYLIFDKTNIL